MYHFVSGFINVTDLSVDVAWQVPRYAPPCLSVNFQFASHFTLVYTLIIGLLLTSIPQKNMIITYLNFQMARMYTEKYRKM